VLEMTAVKEGADGEIGKSIDCDRSHRIAVRRACLARGTGLRTRLGAGEGRTYLNATATMLALVVIAIVCDTFDSRRTLKC